MVEFIIWSFVIGGIVMFYTQHKKEVDSVKQKLEDIVE
jgi:hypothetical protein